MFQRYPVDIDDAIDPTSRSVIDNDDDDRIVIDADRCVVITRSRLFHPGMSSSDGFFGERDVLEEGSRVVEDFPPVRR